ncbi:MAG: hypothetical protein JSS14_27605 [Proteobacteria bacterium]|nr:hypothetical protein [Pseudomonadota bacterium]
MPIPWKRRFIVFVQRFWQPTSACMSCMPGSLGNLLSAPHWLLALQTGLLTGVLALVLTFTPAGRLFSNRYGNALVVGVLTMIGDAFSHPGHYGPTGLEPALTGIVSGLLALGGSLVFEDRAKRLRGWWARLQR